VGKKTYIALALGALSLGGLAFVARHRPHPPAVAAKDAESPFRVETPLAIGEVIYDGKLGAGWEDWGWGRHELPKVGPAKIVFGGYGGIVLHHAEMPARFGAFSFRYKPPEDWPEFLAVTVSRTGSPNSAFNQVVVEQAHVAVLPDGWREVLIDWQALNPSNLPVERISIIARSIVPSHPVLLDKIVLTKPTASVTTSPPPRRDVDLTIICSGATAPISPLIYGATSGDPTSGLTAQRIGGNPTTRFNWDAGNLWNTGSDWFFENGTSDGTVWDWIEGGVKQGLQTALTVPMIGWVAKDATSVGFPWSKISGQRKRDPNRPEAGDGYRPDGSPVHPGSPTETSVAAPPEVIGRWIRSIREKDQARGQRGVHMYLLDNEPSLWSSTHRDVHPEPVGYDELLDRTIRYGSAIRQADPEGVIAGPAEWGWSGYFFSAKDSKAGLLAQPDRRAHNGVPLLPWYLQQLAEYEKTKGVHILDVVDVHYYPAAKGIFGPGARTDREGAELRLRSTRALWDPDYIDESWIKEPIQLIPRLRQWIGENYPGRKLSIGEWSFGADSDISGGLATAEALGRFGQQGLDAAFFYGGPKPGTPVYWAFRAFRDFDGRGGRFLDLSLQTREQEKVSLFASRNASGTQIVAIVVNRDPVFAIRARIKLEACGTARARRVFSYGGDNTSLAEVHPEPGATGPVSGITVAPYSLTVIEQAIERRALP